MGIKDKINGFFGLNENIADIRPFQKNNTTMLFRKIQKCDNDAEFNRLFDRERGGWDRKTNNAWALEYTNNLRGRVQISDARLSEVCSVNIKTANKWKHEAPKKREHYVALACAFGLSAADCSRSMNRYGGYNALDEKNPHDIVYIRLLQISERPFSEFNNEKINTFRDLLYTYENIKSDLDLVNKKAASEKLEKLGDTEFIKLYNYANSVSETGAEKLHNEIVACLKKMGYNSKDAFFKDKNLHSMYPKALSNMSREENKLVPNRNLLISLFLHMALPLNKINELLGMVNMEPLCSKNPYESTVIHVLTQLYKDGSNSVFKDERKMLSSENNNIQSRLKEGSLYMFVHSRLLTFSSKFEEDEVDLNECMCKNLLTEKEKRQ